MVLGGFDLAQDQLWIWRWHGPVTVERAAGSEEGNFGGGPANEDVYCEVNDHLLYLGAEG
jgi:hypothetical protein